MELGEYQTSSAFDDADRLVLDLAVAMAQAPATVPRELYARLRERFDEAQLVELVGAIAWENWRARFNRVFDVQPAGFSEGAFCALPERANA
jgi:alkylhydroperoxidase family enzyme